MTYKFRIAVVLGSGLEADGSATPVTEIRAKTAADLLATKGRMKVICSGSRSLDDKGEHGATEAQVMADIITAQGISPKRTLLEDQSFDTLGNAIFTVDRYLKNKKRRNALRGHFTVSHGTRTVPFQARARPALDGSGS